MTPQSHPINVFDPTPIPPAVALPLIADRIARLDHAVNSAAPIVRNPAREAAIPALVGIVADLAAVVEQLAGVTR